jgi:hypothetical protein
MRTFYGGVGKYYQVYERMTAVASVELLVMLPHIRQDSSLWPYNESLLTLFNLINVLSLRYVMRVYYELFGVIRI